MRPKFLCDDWHMNSQLLRKAVAVVAATSLFGLAACSNSGDSADPAQSAASGSASGDSGESSASDSSAASSTDDSDNSDSSDDPESEQAQSESVFDVSLGDCLMLGDTPSGEVKDLNRIDCDKPHNAEIYAQKDMADGTFPGTEAAVEEAKTYCAQEFGPFVGIPGSDSKLEGQFIHPTQESWDQESDRRIQCVVTDPAGGVTGSMKDAKR